MRHLAVLVGIAGLAFISGCVSTSTYEQMEREKNQEIAALQTRVQALERQRDAVLSSRQQTRQQYDSLMQGLSREAEKHRLQVKQYKNMLMVDLTEQVLFDSGSATLNAEGEEILKTVGAELKGYKDKIIRVVGHTDSVPVLSKSRYLSSWELSVDRAAAVVRFLQKAGIPPSRMIAAGRGEYDPVAPNDTPEGRQKNRRIEIMLIDQSLADELAGQGK